MSPLLAAFEAAQILTAIRIAAEPCDRTEPRSWRGSCRGRRFPPQEGSHMK